MSSLRDIMIAQIKKSATEKEGMGQDESQKQFLYVYDQELLHDYLNILNQITASLESKDPAFFPLRDRLIKIITDNPSYEIPNKREVRFSVYPTTKPPYRILFEVSWDSHISIVLFAIINCDRNIHLNMSIPWRPGGINLPYRPNEAAIEIIKFLMTV
jgi:hypothetical protein